MHTLVTLWHDAIDRSVGRPSRFATSIVIVFQIMRCAIWFATSLVTLAIAYTVSVHATDDNCPSDVSYCYIAMDDCFGRCIVFPVDCAWTSRISILCDESRLAEYDCNSFPQKGFSSISRHVEAASPISKFVSETMDPHHAPRQPGCKALYSMKIVCVIKFCPQVTYATTTSPMQGVSRPSMALT